MKHWRLARAAVGLAASGFALLFAAGALTAANPPRPDWRPLLAVRRPGTLGLGVAPLTPGEAKRLKGVGVRVHRVEPRSPARAAGMERGDLIVSLNGRPIRGVPAFMRVVTRAAAGDEVRIELYRNGQRLTKTAMLARAAGLPPAGFALESASVLPPERMPGATSEVRGMLKLYD